MTAANAKQREEWNNGTASRWLEKHELVDKQIRPFGQRAMDRSDIKPGERVLDVGCGCGETTRDLARRVGEAGSVIGIDISAKLIDAARVLARKSSLANIRFEEADAQTHRFPIGSVDIVFSRFGIMFFDDPIAAFGNLRSALSPAGRLAFVCWPAPHENLFMTIPKAAAERHINLPPPGDPDDPGPFALADADRVRGILSRAGFAEIEVQRVTEKVGGGSLDETTRMLLQLGPLGELASNARSLDHACDRGRYSVGVDQVRDLGPRPARRRGLAGDRALSGDCVMRGHISQGSRTHPQERNT